MTTPEYLQELKFQQYINKDKQNLYRALRTRKLCVAANDAMHKSNSICALVVRCRKILTKSLVTHSDCCYVMEEQKPRMKNALDKMHQLEEAHIAAQQAYGEMQRHLHRAAEIVEQHTNTWDFRLKCKDAMPKLWHQSQESDIVRVKVCGTTDELSNGLLRDIFTRRERLTTPPLLWFSQAHEVLGAR